MTRESLSAPTPGRSGALLLLGGLCMARFAAFVFRLHVVPFFTDFASQYQITYLDTGLLLSVFLGAYSLVLLPVGVLTDRGRPERLLLMGVCLFAAGSAVFAGAGSWGALLVSRAVLGVGAAMVYVPTLKLIAVHFGAAQRGRMLGLAELAGGFGTLSGLSLFPALAPWIPNRSLILAVGILSLLAGYAVVRGVGGVRPWARRPASASAAGATATVPASASTAAVTAAGQSTWKQLCAPAPLLLCGITGATLFGWTSFMGWTPAYLQEALHLSRQTVVLITGLGTVVQMASAYAAGQISDRIGRRKPVLVAGLLMAAGGMVMYLLIPGWPGAAAAAVLVGVGAPWALNAGMALSTELLGPGRAGALGSLTALVGMMSGAVAGVGGGWIRDVTGSYLAIWLAAAAILGLTSLAAQRLRT